MASRSCSFIFGVALVLGTGLLLKAQDGMVTNVFHFSGPGKACPEILSLVERTGGRVDWGINNLIAYDQFDPQNQRFQVWVMAPDGSGARNVSSLNSTLATIDAGNPAWHPSGNYLVLQAADMQKPEWASTRAEMYKRITNPGAGYNNNLWLISTDGSHAAALSQLNQGQGVLHAHFSHSGGQLLWSELESTNPQKWVMKIAHFKVDSDGPHVTDVQTLDPLGNAFYETHDFSPDDKKILFATTTKPGDYKHMSIVEMDLASGETKALTGSDDWNEHAHFSPDGSKIIWASSRDIDQNDALKITRNDFWIMNADGSGKKRLTYFNQPGAPEYRPTFNIASDLSWSPDGKAFVAYLQLRTKGEAVNEFTGSILRITLP
jgi:Tol biopolymer transport system component